MNRLTSPTGRGAIHDVVVNQREVVKDFDRGGGVEGTVGITSDGMAGEHHENSPDSLAPPFEDVAGRLIERPRRAPFGDGRQMAVDRLSILLVYRPVIHAAVENGIVVSTEGSSFSGTL